MQTIPFKVFMAGGTSIAPDPSILTMVDGGLTFFVSTGAIILGLIALEKAGVTINEGLVRTLMWSGVLIAFIWAVFKNPLFRSLVVGF